MTIDQFGQMVEQDNVLAVLRKKMEREYPKHRGKADDWVSRAMNAGLKKCGEFQDARGAKAYLADKAVFIAKEDIERDKERRQLLSDLPHYGHQRDPMRAVDFKVDLEHAIRDSVSMPIMRTALWHIVYEKFTWEEVLDLLPGDRPRNTWEWLIAENMKALKQEMRRKDYRL